MGRTIARPGEADARERILRSAIRLFAQKGYDGAPVAAIADGAGVNRALPFYYWETKRSLYSAAVGEGLGLFTAMTRAALTGPGSASDRLSAFVAGHLRLLWHQGDLMRVVDRCLLDGHVAELGLAERFQGTVQQLEGFFREAATAGEFRGVRPEFAARLLLGPGFIFSMWKLFEAERFSEAELAALITDQLLLGFRRRFPVEETP